jgi:hypothetical protein
LSYRSTGFSVAVTTLTLRLLASAVEWSNDTERITSASDLTFGHFPGLLGIGGILRW